MEPVQNLFTNLSVAKKLICGFGLVLPVSYTHLTLPTTPYV